MTRATPEWHGKTDDTPVPLRVRLRVFEAHGGKCHITGQKINPGDAWDLDHVLALINGGENREGNLAPALRHAHRAKTARDVAQKAKDTRIRAKHVGAAKPKAAMPGSRASGWKRKLDGTLVRRVAE